MARRPRVHYAGALYHVISRGNQRQKIYRDDEDYRRFATLLGEVGKRHGLVLYAYVLMPNHFHLLLEVGRTPLSKAMQALLYRYTRGYNQRYRKSGHLFQGRYTAILCDRDNYLMVLIRYLHMNPVRAGMVKQPGHYRWSSHESYTRGESSGGVAVEQALQLWGRQRSRAIEAYRQFIREGFGEKHQEEYYEVKDQRYLGDDKFVEAACRKIEEQEPAYPVRITMQEIIGEMVKESGISARVLLGKGRGRMASRLRAEAAYIAREVGGIRLTEVAKYLGRDLSTVSLAVKKLEDELATDPVRRQEVEMLCNRSRQGRQRIFPITKA